MAAEYALGLLGQDVVTVAQAAVNFSMSVHSPVYGFACELFALMRKLGLRSAVISGAPQTVLDRYAAAYAIDEVLGLRVGVDRGEPIHKSHRI